MKNQYKIIGIAIIILILVGSIFYLSSGDKGSTEEKSTSENKKTLLSSIKEVKQIQINSEVILKKVARDQWEAIDLEREADTSKINHAVETISALEGTKTDKNMEETGLTTPQVEIEIVGEEEEKVSIFIGAKTDDNLSYYVSISGEDAIFKVDAVTVEAIPFQKHAVTDNHFLAITSETVNEIIIDNGIQTIRLKPESEYEEEEVRTNLTGWYMHEPYDGAYSVKYNKMTNMIYGLDKLEIEKVISDKADNLKEYGLENVDFTITLNSNDESEKILIGDPAGGAQTYYAMLKGKSTVFTIRKEALNPYSYQAFDIVERFVKILAIDIVKQLKIEGKAKEHVIDITHNENDTNEDERVTALTFKIDGKPIGEDSFRDLYKQIAGLSVDKEVEDAAYQKPEASISYTILTDKSNKKEILIELVQIGRAHV